jgi:hypothetical protein
MARKLTQKKKQETTLLVVPHRTPNLSALLEKAKTGNAQAVKAYKAYLDAGGSPDVHVFNEGAAPMQQMPLVLHLAWYNSHPHNELAESMRLLVEAGADINALADNDDCTAVMYLSRSEYSCCTTALQVFLQNEADVFVSTTSGKQLYTWQPLLSVLTTVNCC